MRMSIGERIRRARRATKLTQAAVAGSMGVDQSTVARWEAGESEPGWAQVEPLARLLGSEPEWLAFGRHTAGARAAGAAATGTGPRVVAFQGRPGAYSQLACRDVLPEHEPLPSDTFEDAFAAVENGRAALGMIPIENALGGRVADIHRLLPESNLYIVGEHFQPVHHHLLAVEGATLEGLRTVVSHPQALAQCREIVRELGLRAEPTADTAGAAREVAEAGDPTVAAIASEIAGEIYGLTSLRARIEDRIGNVTRFVLMSRQRIEPDPANASTLTSLVFQVRSVPAALYKALGGFATNTVNIIRLESYISISDPTVARFYVEAEGHPAHKEFDRALEELQFFSTKVKILGVYPAHPFRLEA